MPESLPTSGQAFSTTDRVLAEALLLAGCKPAPFSDYGPAMNIYNRGMFYAEPVVRSRVEMAVFRAFTRKKEYADRTSAPNPGPVGIVSYRFLREPPFEECMTAWDAIPAELENAKQANRPPIFPDVKSTDVMRVKFLDRLQKQEMEIAPWKQLPVLCDGQIETKQVPMKLAYALAPGVEHPMETHSEGSGLVWNWNCSAEFRARVGLPPLAPEIKAYLASRKQ